MAHKRSKAGASSVASNGGNSDEKEVSEVRFNVDGLFPSIIINANLAVSGRRPTILYYLTRSDLLLHRVAHPFRDNVREICHWFSSSPDSDRISSSSERLVSSHSREVRAQLTHIALIKYSKHAVLFLLHSRLSSRNLKDRKMCVAKVARRSINFTRFCCFSGVSFGENVRGCSLEMISSYPISTLTFSLSKLAQVHSETLWCSCQCYN